MVEIYVVTGKSGSYSDRVVWIAAAFRELSAACAFIEKARAAAAVCNQWAIDECEAWSVAVEYIESCPKNTVDPKMQLVDSDGCTYHYEKVTLR